MNQSSILGPSGNRMVEFGGNNAWKSFGAGDINVSFQWLDTGHESGEPQACMCLYSAKATTDSGAFAIPQEDSYRYALANGDPTPYLLGFACKAIAHHLGFGAFDSFVQKRIISTIVNYMPDLINMPNSQPLELNQAKAIQGIEVSLKKDGKVIHEALI